MTRHPRCQLPAIPDHNPSKKSFFHFWLSFPVVSLAYAWYCFYVPSNSIAWADNDTAAQQKAVEADKPVILYFIGK